MQIVNKNRGFTLVELLVVITIISILAVAGLASYTQATKSARDSKRKSDMEALKQALVMYKQENPSAYPPAATYTTVTALVNYLADTARGYLGQGTVIVDPQSPGVNYTYTTPTTTSFCLCADVENTAKGNSSGSCAGWGTTGSFYCVASP